MSECTNPKCKNPNCTCGEDCKCDENHQCVETKKCDCKENKNTKCECTDCEC